MKTESKRKSKLSRAKKNDSGKTTLAEMKKNEPMIYIVGKNLVKIGEYPDMQAWVDEVNESRNLEGKKAMVAKPILD